MSIAYMRYPNGVVGLDRKIWGYRQRQGFTDFAKEISTVHAMELVLQINGMQPIQDKIRPHYFAVQAGISLTCARLKTWFTTGKWHLKSIAGEFLANQMQALADRLKCPLILPSFHSDKPEDDFFKEDLDVGLTEIEISYIRLRRLIDAEGLKPLGPRIPHTPITVDELKNAIKVRREIDELHAIKMLRREDSQASEISLELGLTREIIRQALSQRERDRAKQVVLCSILRATRFKFYESGDVLKTSCAKCGEEDNFRHLLQRVALPAPTP